MTKWILFLCVAALAAAACSSVDAPEPAPFGAVPTERQMIWHGMEMHAFIHFGPNTFSGVEWGDGRESPDLFHPTELDCRQWVKVLKDAGMEGVVITAKHHDGFCLWPSQYSTHTVRESSWRNGQGDVLRELSEACREFGLKFGVYVSPWDRNHPAYFTDEYNTVFKNMLEEVMTGYGDVYYLFLDGAFSVGPDGRRQEYDWDGFVEVVRRLQPDCVIFSDAGPDVRWVGNEDGHAAETNWSTVHSGVFYPGIPGVSDQLLTGHEDGDLWIPTEVDVSIRPGWFYRESEDAAVKSVGHLIDIWYRSVGMNGNLLLNVPPDRRGIIHENDIRALMGLRAHLDAAFAENLALGGKAEATNVRSNSRKYDASQAVDGDPETYWATDDGVTSASLEIDLAEPATVGTVLLREYIRLGQRVRAFAVEAHVDGDYLEVARGTTIGNRRILRIPPLETRKLRIHFDAKAAPLISTVAVYR
ncbi:MAG: alpha-L-fucosidase [Acidobacteriota bacterium]|nr:alpha-L-fucosidase [Acidobacteriota bacterium]